MFVIRFIHRKIDPDGLITGKAWLAIGALGIQAGLVFAAAIVLLVLEKKSLETSGMLWLLSFMAGFVFLMLLYTMVRTVRKVMHDRRSFNLLHEEQKKNLSLTHNLINILPIGYHSLNKHGIIIEMNQTELDWLGYTREEVIGKKHVSDLYADDSYHDRFEELMEEFKKQGEVNNVEYTMLSKDGRHIPALITSKVLLDEAGNFERSITMVYNFTERKKLEDDLISARQEAENARRLKQLFMANMSHEIRTPLNAIIGFANLLSRAGLAKNLKEYVQSIQISGTNLLAIVNDILDFEKIRSGMLRIEQIEFDLPGLLHSVTTMLRTSAEEKHLILELKTDPNLPMLVVGDPMRLTQILVNLLGNAIKFTEFGSVTLDVQVMSAPGDSIRILFKVEDTGIGIAESEHSRIFERFMQASNDMSRKYGGTGLGLALVKMLVELQDGCIVLTSAPGKGSSFHIEIPYQTVRDQKIMPTVLSSDNITVPDLSGYHVLLVEDNPMNRRIAELNLKEFGLEVTMAEDGYKALELLHATPHAFDLVFIDIQMPGIDGHQTTRTIRSELGLHDLPIVALTAHVFAGEREKVLASGMNDYLTKPVVQNDLINVLLRFLPGFWDFEAFQEHTLGNAKIGNEIARLFIQQFPQEMITLQAALQQQDFVKTASVSHFLRSSAAYAGFQQVLADPLLQLEQEAKKESPDPDVLNEIYTLLSFNARRAVSVIQREIGPKD
ncbi:MAG TPA: ATP-binding protein [Saprospiraceae bacterium]|nr:ATP-binding protein [Saprospiraceae bacterium]